MNDNLRKTVMVAKIHEQDAAVVTKAENPTRKLDGLASVCGAKFIAVMCTIRVHIFYSPK